MGIRQSAKKFQHKLQPQPFSVVAPVPVNGTSKILKKSRKMSAESSKTHGGLRAVYCSYGCSKYKQQDGNGNLNELKGHIKMLLIENRELRIENAEFKKMVKVDEIEKLVRKVAKQKEIKRANGLMRMVAQILMRLQVEMVHVTPLTRIRRRNRVLRYY
ncbi:GRAM domain-containing 4 [Gossypium arboreum]|uniref:GRAM domain-containing 4 n=1 Tax=Gossypium arboreum TaxID=29729 RepID=A0A0B0NAR0_GOSAR|nr:GRAM domain-containing 4 [Gossypium arboreum]